MSPRRMPVAKTWSRALGIALALVAGVLQGVLAGRPTNDDFLHRVLAQQWLAGDWPVRDFFDSGLTLMFGLSAIMEAAVGYRLLSEAVLVGVMLAVSTYLVFRLVRELTGSTMAAAVSAILLIVAGPRGYSYPKIVVYAMAATLWWGYVREPTRARALALGAWTAVAFYWRPDHGLYVGIGTALALFVTHGFRAPVVVRGCQSAAAALALVAPFVIFVSATVGLQDYARSGLILVDSQHARTDTHAWPKWPVRHVSDVIGIDASEVYAPTIGLRWSAESSPEARVTVLERYALTPLSTEDRSVQVRLSDRAIHAIRDLVNEPIVEDTAGVDRATATLPWTTWPAWERWPYEHAFLRVRVFAGVEEHTNAGQAVAALFYLLPVVVVVVAILLRRQLAGTVTSPQLVAFALFGLVSDIGLLRTPYEVRAVDGVVLPAILFGCVLALMWRAASLVGVWRRAVLTVTLMMMAILVVKSVAVAGQFGDRINWLAGDWRSPARMRGAWTDMRQALLAKPPLTYWEAQPAPASIELARYAQTCVPLSERLLVLWFAPEIFYYSDRLMAQRHLVFVRGYERLEHEQQLTLAKIRHFAPPIVLATAALDTYTRELYPGVVEYVRHEYEVGGTLEESGDQYLILARRGRPIVRRYGEQNWPCYA